MYRVLEVVSEPRLSLGWDLYDMQRTYISKYYNSVLTCVLCVLDEKVELSPERPREGSGYFSFVDGRGIYFTKKY
jgi:hypothetical protein